MKIVYEFFDSQTVLSNSVYLAQSIFIIQDKQNCSNKQNLLFYKWRLWVLYLLFSNNHCHKMTEVHPEEKNMIIIESFIYLILVMDGLLVPCPVSLPRSPLQEGKGSFQTLTARYKGQWSPCQVQGVLKAMSSPKDLYTNIVH